MSVIRQAALGYRRLRHSHGHGVHSPFAFFMVCQVLRQDYAYYADTEIREAMTAADRPRALRMAEVVHRMVARLSPKTVYLPESAPRMLRIAVERAGSRAVVTHSREKLATAELAVADAHTITGDELRDMLAQEGKTLLLTGGDRSLFMELHSRLSCGLTLCGRRSALIFTRQGMTPTFYDIRLPF